MLIFRGIRLAFTVLTIGALLLLSAVFSVLLYAKVSGREVIFSSSGPVFADYETPLSTPQPNPPQAAEPVKETVEEQPVKASAMIDAPVIHQFPELPSGCEITSLTMLLQFYGVQKSKMEMAYEMKKDTTPIVWGPNGTIKSWGNPNTGFVGDVYGKSKGFGIYHTALFELLQSYVPTAVDLTRSDFSALEKQISDGVPVVAWTTINFTDPGKWVTWDTPIGPIETTFMEHAVLLVGYDSDFVYANDPWTGKGKVKVDKQQFIQSWTVMGKQAISYTNS
ncbi:C39 family peptidase [Paenibacillus sp. y28]|uniref:C39 family peptidase n=1 Tax=Paenibacillus sp. y28 TaxID=3129110 RepID=UPI003018766C